MRSYKYNVAVGALVIFFSCLTSFLNASADVFFPKYFFTDEINPKCKMKGFHGYGSFKNKGKLLPLNLNDKENISYLRDFINYDWEKDHDDRSNSLDVFLEEMSNRLNLINASLVNALIEDDFFSQSKYAADILTLWAENNSMMSTINTTELLELIKKGKKKGKCYDGNQNIKADCTWHTAQEAARYAGQYIINATLIKNSFTKSQLAIVSAYIDELYERHISTWVKNSRKSIGFYQMGDGGISVVAYAHWKKDSKIAQKEFRLGFKKIDEVWYKDGYINNNSFRGVRDIWYHTLALNNALGYVALAYQWGIIPPRKVADKLNRSAFIHKLGIEDLRLYRKRKFDGYIGNSTSDRKHARENTHPQAPFIDWLEINFTDLSNTEFLENDMIWKFKKRYNYTDRMLGFNPTCMVQEYKKMNVILNEIEIKFNNLNLLRRKVIQDELKPYGYNASLDGIWGGSTKNAFTRFIRENISTRNSDDIIRYLLQGN